MEFNGQFDRECAAFEEAVGCARSFDVVARSFRIGSRALKLYFINGLIQTDSAVKVLGDLLALDSGEYAAVTQARQLAQRFIPFTESDTTTDFQTAVTALLSGQAVLLAEGVAGAVLMDVRQYASRTPDEPENNRVLLGPHEGFNEVLLQNTALLRRRLRDPSLTITLLQIGTRSKLDVAVCFVDGKADQKMLQTVMDKLQSIRVETLAMAQESLLECLVPGRHFNPFPRVRYTERPDSAAASAAEGSILVITDNSPAVMVIPSGFFDFLQDTNDFYFPPMLGSFLRLVRLLVFSSTMFLTPVWYLLIRNPQHIPQWLDFIRIDKPIAVPVLVQLIAIELVIDALKLASINTPNSLSNSFSVIGALVLGQFAVEARWLTAEVVFYMAFVAVANFTQPSFEMGHAYKMARIFVLVLTALFNYAGFFIGYALVFAVLVSTKNVVGRGYLYPLIPFNGPKLARLLIRRPIHRDNAG
ncbi:MAG: spore germination protein [Clostridia bacterium]|nr:spore germination protein [Clostridia bacterium]